MLTLTSDAALGLFAYVFAASCDAAMIQKDCQSAGVSGDVSPVSAAKAPAQLVFKPTTSGDYHVAIDSTSAGSFGAFTLKVEEK